MKTNSSIFYLFILFACAILSPVFGSPAPTCDVGEACVELRDDAQDLALKPDAQKTIDYIKANAAEINKKPICFYSGTTKIKGKDAVVFNYIKTLETAIGQNVQILADIIKEAGLNSNGWKVTPDWDETSKALAEYASGDHVYVLLGQSIRPKSVYTRIEEPTLASNKKITGLHVYELQTDGSVHKK